MDITKKTELILLIGIVLVSVVVPCIAFSFLSVLFSTGNAIYTLKPIAFHENSSKCAVVNNTNRSHIE